MKPFVPNGCTSSPDGIGALKWKSCCDRHDLAYYVGGPNPLRKWRADLGLGWCMAKRWARSVREPVPWWRRAARAAGSVAVPAAYVAVTATVGLLPMYWNYRGNPMPSNAELSALASWRRS